MPGTVPDASERHILNQLRAAWTGNTFLCIFRNDIIPGPPTVIGGVIEANFSGYARIPITGWQLPTTEGTRARMEADVKTFAVSASPSVGNSCFGYYVIDNFGNLLWIQRADNPPIPMFVFGDTYTVKPVFKLQTEV